jgi:ribonucleoside-diphosphate reductase alpha chain
MDFEWLNKKSKIFLSGGYLEEGEDPIHRVRDIAATAEIILGIKGFADRFLDHAAKGHFLFSSPVWANFGRKRGLPISCFGSYVPDTMEGILDTNSEIGMMSKMGGGTSAYYGAVRSRGSKISTGGKSDGSVSFMRINNVTVDVSKQSKVRRGICACYLPIDHGDIEEFLQIKHEGHPIQHLFTGVTVSNQWMREMIEGDVEKRKIWAKVIKSRFEIGLPYIFFSDNVNDNKPQVYKDLQKEIYASNVCSEIMLPSNTQESFVCCLSSMNLLHYHDWKDTDAVEIMMQFLDAIMSEFIAKASLVPHMERAVRFAAEHRAVGMGATGWHSLLQSKGIPFGSLEALQLNKEIFSLMDEQSLEASRKMAETHGTTRMMAPYNERWATRMSLAPNTSSAFILGQVSQSKEPIWKNYYTKELAKIDTPIKNPELVKLFAERNIDEKVWRQILLADGSIQNLNVFDDHEKEVFKTFPEIAPKDIIMQAAGRQPYIDQGQSTNLMIHPDTPAKEMNELLIYAWENGIKSLYYQHNASNAAQTFYRKNLNECSVCEG